MIIALFPNVAKSQTKHIAIGIREFLNTQGIKVVAEDKEAKEIGAELLSSVDPHSLDFLISLGGDGTILRLIHRFPELTAPILGINMGSLGFMADIPVVEIYPSLQEVIDGKYLVHELIMLEGETAQGERCFAINDLVVHRAQNPCLVDLAIHVDGIYLNTFSADGVIIATPCGSTAYSLAAGGPILTPEIEALVLTPISPHTLSNRPIVLLPNHQIQIQYLSEREPIEIAFDGMTRFSMTTGEVFHIRLSSRRVKLISMLHHDYFSTLRTKLNWTGKLRI